MNSSYDPYDIWSTEMLGRLKVSYTNGNFLAKFTVIFVGVVELISPVMFRKLLRIKKNIFPHVEAMALSYDKNDELKLQLFKELAIKLDNGVGWGLPFKWFSKNGIYGSNTPYITNTPYIMSVLICRSWPVQNQDEVNNLFYSTWNFLNSLKVLYSSENHLALSYAPIDEPRMVINANTYAAFAYALHAVYGEENVKVQAIDKVNKLINWIIAQQQKNGSWLYYADNDFGNFIDCFHSCFVIKNLIKVKQLLPEFAVQIEPAIESGWSYLQDNFYDKKSGMCRRFVQRDIKDPFRWDLYDQAEYLGLLVDFDLLDEAKEFAAHIEKKFKKGEHWYCRIDIFGRRWGKNFMRWGIVPFLYHKARLDSAIIKEDKSCVAS